ncbi:MAG: tRNA lysidine(34) synthetase TilS [Phycisphaera sp.]|nr:MAG: tRNA lysidine(34) synthetase TilS [Phycisphaera sp.]
MADRNAQSITRGIVTRWRTLTGGSSVRDCDRPTLVALSGGADSSGLQIALSSIKPAKIVAAHVRHDLRPAADRDNDAEAARQLAHKLGVEFHLADISVPTDQNQENAARSLRYDTLSKIAADTGCHYVATAHHAEDQLETMLMALTRGSGLAGVSGIAETRRIEHGVTLIRPTLRSTRAELQTLCDSLSWAPAHDATNEDTALERAWFRARIMPTLLEHTDAGFPDRLASLSALLRQSQLVVEARARELAASAMVSDGKATLRCELLTSEQPVVIGECLRTLAQELVGTEGADARGYKHLDPIIECIRSSPEHAREFELRGLRVRVTRKTLEITVHSPGRTDSTSDTRRSSSDGSPEL